MEKCIENLGGCSPEKRAAPAQKLEVPVGRQMELRQRYYPQLPHDYMRFMNAYGCIRFHELVGIDLHNASRPCSASVDSNFSLETDNNFSVWGELHTYEGRIPDQMLPIWDSMGGNLFLLSLRAEDHGSIHYWDHEEGETVYVASGIEAFICAINKTPPPPATMKVVRLDARQTFMDMLEKYRLENAPDNHDVQKGEENPPQA